MDFLLSTLQLRLERLTEALKGAAETLNSFETGVARDRVIAVRINVKNRLLSLTTDLDRYLSGATDIKEDFCNKCRDTQVKAEDTLTELEIAIKLYCHEGENSHRTRLPKLELGKYNGDILKWNTFWDNFVANVDSKDIANVEKLSYLLASLEGPALQAVEGLETTNINYPIAVDILNSRFGKPTKVIDAHNEALQNLAVAKDSPEDCRRTLNIIEKHLRVLEALGEKVDASHLRVIILNKFPSRVVYQVRLMSTDDSFAAIRKAVDAVITAMESSVVTNMESSVIPVRSSDTTEMGTPASTATLQIGAVKKRKWQQKREAISTQPNRKRPKRMCIFCNEEHYSEDCTKYNTYKERIGKLKDRCYVCFQIGHRAFKCTRRRKCVHCSRMHNRALCRQKVQKGETSDMILSNKTSTNAQLNKPSNFLQTAVTQVRTAEGRSLSIRLLLDSGSQRTYITNRIAKLLRIKPDGEDCLMIYTFGSEKPREMLCPYATITVVSKRNVERLIRVNIVPYITAEVPIAKVESPMIDILADDASTGEGIDLLIGNDLFFSFIRKSVDLGNNTFLVDSDFGWFLAGSANNREGDTLSVATYCQCHDINQDFTEPDLPLRTIDVKFLWSLESIGICDSPKTTCEEEAVQHFNKTVKYSEGRYQVKWPWIEYPPKLPTNFGLAFGRLKGVLRRSNKEVITEYEKILKEQLEANIIEVVDPTIPADHPVHYLPFHMVQQKGKSGRLVYDASAKLKNEKSLNECLYRGPNMLEDLTGLILKFRIGEIAITADVEKAFLQVGLQEEDRDVTRFLWVNDLERELTEDNIMQYRFCRVPFGVISSPFLLAATIRYHLSKTNKSLLPVIADKCYVDNLVTSVQSREEALNLYAQTTNSFKELGMNIRDWMSNDKDFVDNIPKQKRAKQESEMKILGLLWNLENDTLRLKLNNETFESEIIDRGITKKGILRVLARLYDPCGFVSPLMLPGKLLFQEICTRKLKWDDILPEDLSTSWRNIIENFKTVTNVELPRHVANGLKSEFMKYELHCFTDASMNAYAAVVYLRVIAGKQVSTSFLMSKSRVTPAEDKSDLKIPRLELLGYLIGSRLLRYVKSHIDLNIHKIYLWTDSQVVIAWIKSSRLLPPFVLRRVNEIKQIKDILGAELRYVNSKENPADIATRPELWHHKQDLWLHGPDFLLQDQSDWPKEQGKEEMCLAGRALDTLDGPEMTMKGYEDQDSDLNFSEMEVNPADTALQESLESMQNPSDEEKCEETVTEIKKLQGKYFSEEVSGKVTSLSRNLGLFVDEDGILRCKGRFANANLSYDKRYPILIPKKSSFTNEIILKTHRDNYHVGVPHTLSILREKYWIPHGRAQVQKALKRCSQCDKYSGGPYKLPPPPALPSERVNYSSPFTFTGLDYLGPVLVQTNTGREKRWICLMTCLAIRAVHLEMVKALTAEECLLAIRRFVAARGPPKVLISDNALQFKLTSEVLIHSYCQEKHINWKFITQLAPWQGGFYERLVALVKHCLKRTLDKHLLTDGQMHTVVKEIEAVLNTRPLTAVGSDPEGVLRPADFLSLGQCLEINPELGEGTSQGTNTKVDLVEGWKRGQRILNEYKEMFTNQYLPSLRDRFSHSHKQPRVMSKKSPKVGDIVQIKNDSKNRINWKVGKISSLIRSRDGECRAAKVVVGNTEFTRSIAHLYPLESDTYGPTNYAQLPSYDNEMVETPTEHMDVAEALEPIKASEKIVSPKPEMEIDELTIPTESATEKDVSVLDSEDSPTQTEQAAAAADTHEAEVREPSVMEERPEEATRIRRNAAIWARERIAEWTRQLMTLLM